MTLLALTGECHPACDLLPPMTEDEYRGLVEDIRAHGLRERIIVDCDSETDEARLILDGRHRWRACQELGIEPLAGPFYGTEAEKVSLIISANICRRHLTTTQRSAIAAELATMKSGARTDLAPNDARSELSDAQAAKLLKVSERTVERAKARMREDPAAHEQAKAGTLPRRIDAFAHERAATTRTLRRAMRRQTEDPEPAPPVPVAAAAPAPAAPSLLIAWLRDGPVNGVAFRLKKELGQERLDQLAAALGYEPARQRDLLGDSQWTRVCMNPEPEP